MCWNFLAVLNTFQYLHCFGIWQWNFPFFIYLVAFLEIMYVVKLMLCSIFFIANSLMSVRSLSISRSIHQREHQGVEKISVDDFLRISAKKKFHVVRKWEKWKRMKKIQEPKKFPKEVDKRRIELLTAVSFVNCSSILIYLSLPSNEKNI